MVFSFNTMKLNIRWEGFTTRWYGVLFNDQQVILATQNTLIIAVISTVVATILGTHGGAGAAPLPLPGLQRLGDDDVHPDRDPRSDHGDLACWCSSSC